MLRTWSVDSDNPDSMPLMLSASKSVVFALLGYSHKLVGS